MKNGTYQESASDRIEVYEEPLGMFAVRRVFANGQTSQRLSGTWATRLSAHGYARTIAQGLPILHTES